VPNPAVLPVSQGNLPKPHSLPGFWSSSNQSIVAGTSPRAPPQSPSCTKEEVAKMLHGKCHCSHSRPNTSFRHGIRQNFPLSQLNEGRRGKE